MDEAPQEFYSEDRWQNWLTRIEDEDIDPDDESSARLLLNLQDDIALAVAKVLIAFENELIDADQALDELETIRGIVLSEVDIDDEETALLVDGVQTSLMCVLFAGEEFIASGAAMDGSIDDYLQAAADAEAEEDFDAALGYAAQAGTRVIDGNEFDPAIAEHFDYGLVTEWINGLDSLQSALRDPEVIEEE